jgi:hypothetical protein
MMSVARFISMVLRSSALMTSASAALDGFLVLDAGERMQARLRRRAHAAMHALVVVAELLSAKRRRAATNPGDLDMSAAFSVFHEIDPVKNLLVLRT